MAEGSPSAVERQVRNPNSMCTSSGEIVHDIGLEKPQDQAPKARDQEERDHDHRVLARMAVGAEQHEVAHAGGGQQARHERCEAQDALQVELRDHHARRAVGHQAYQRRGEHREESVARKEARQRALAHRLEQRHEGERNKEDEDGNLHRVGQGAHHDGAQLAAPCMLVTVIVGAAVGVLVTVIVGAAVGVLDSVVVLGSVAGTVIAPALMPRMAVVAAVIVPMTVMVRMTAPAVVLLAQAADMLGILAALCHLLDHVGLHAIAAHGEHRAAQELVHARVAAQRADQQVGGDARDEGYKDLQPQDLEEQAGIDALGHQHGQHLVGSRKEHRRQRAQRDHAAGVERRRHSREPALRHHAQQRARHGPRRACATHDGVGTAARRMLERLERQVGYEQERHQPQRILQGMLDKMQHHMHRRFSSTEYQ